MSPKNMAVAGESIRNVADLLRLNKKSVYFTGRQFAIAKCLELYGEQKLKALTPDAQRKLLKENYPRTEVLAYFKIWIIEFLNSVNVKTSLTPTQIDFVAQQMFSCYSWNEYDLMLFFRNIRSGIYGQLYENLSSEKILEWANDYWADRTSVGELISEEHKPFSITKDKMDPKVFSEMFKDVKEPESEPPVIKKKASTFMDSEKGFRAYLANICNTADAPQLIKFIEAWKMVSSQKSYVDIFCGALVKVDKSADEYCDNVLRILKLEDDYSRSGSDKVLHEIELLNKSVELYTKTRK